MSSHAQHQGWMGLASQLAWVSSLGVPRDWEWVLGMGSVLFTFFHRCAWLPGASSALLIAPSGKVQPAQFLSNHGFHLGREEPSQPWCGVGLRGGLLGDTNDPEDTSTDGEHLAFVSCWGRCPPSACLSLWGFCLVCQDRAPDNTLRSTLSPHALFLPGPASQVLTSAWA